VFVRMQIHILHY